MSETYSWLLVPEASPQDSGRVTWSELRLSGEDALSIRASRKLVGEEMLVTAMAGTRLEHELNKIPLWRGDDVPVRQLWDDFCRYLYLPRVKDADVLLNAVASGVSSLMWGSETFAYAESKDDSTDRCRGLAGGRHISPTLEGGSVLVKPGVARRQMDEDEAEHRRREAEQRRRDGDLSPDPEVDTLSHTKWEETVLEPLKPKALRRFHGSVRLSALRLGRDASVVADEIVAQLAALPGAEVEVTLEIRALLAEGVPDDVVRTVTENAATLKFSSQGFEED